MITYHKNAQKLILMSVKTTNQFRDINYRRLCADLFVFYFVSLFRKKVLFGG